MSEFFRGWRRKMGIVTLALAVAFMGAWIRSMGVEDYFDSLIDDLTIIALGTARQSLIFYKKGTMDDNDRPSPALISRESSNGGSGDSQINERGEATLEDGYRLAPYQTTISCSFPVPVPLVEIPFAIIVVPLTLLSAYLLLAKSPVAPRKFASGALMIVDDR